MLENNQEKQIFYPKLWWRLLPLLGLIVYLFIYTKLCFAFWEGRVETLTIIAMTILLLCIVFFAYLFAYKTRLIISEDGLEIEGIFAGKASWNGLVEISSNTFSPLLSPGFRTWGFRYY